MKLDTRFAVPLYTAAQAARYLGVPATTFASWAKGYRRRRSQGKDVYGSPVVTSIAATGQQPSIPFIGLAEGLVLAAVRGSGVPMQRVRPALEELARELRIEHALASKRLYTDGAEILFDYAKESLDEDEVRELVVIRNKQRVFSEVVDRYLRRIDYGHDGYATLIRLPTFQHAEVVCDPTRGFGRPIFTHGAVRVDDVLDRFYAGESIEELSLDFGVPVADLEDALRASGRAA